MLSHDFTFLHDFRSSEGSIFHEIEDLLMYPVSQPALSFVNKEINTLVVLHVQTFYFYQYIRNVIFLKNNKVIKHENFHLIIKMSP